MQNQKQQSIIDVKDLKKIIQQVVSNWYIIVGVLIVAVFVGYLYNSIQAKLYTARVGIAVINKGQQYNGYSEEEVISINSRDLIEKTINDLKLDVSFCKKSNNSKIEIFDSLPFHLNIGVLNDKLYETEFQLNIINNSEFEIEYELNGVKKRENGYFDSIISTNDFRLEILKNIEKLDSEEIESNNFSFKIHNKANIINKYQAALKVNLHDEVNELLVEYKNAIPEQALRFLESLSKNYIAQNFEGQLNRNSKMLGSINSMLFKTETILKGLQDSLNIHKSLGSDFLGERLLAFESNLIYDKKKLEYYLDYMNDVEKYIYESIDVGIPPPLFLDENTDLFLKSALAEIYQIQLDKKDKLKNITEKTHEISRLESKFEIRKADLLKYLKNTRESVKIKIDVLAQQIDQNKSKLNNSSISELENKITVNESMYLDLLSKKNSMVLAESSMDSAYKVFESPNIIESPSDLKFLYLSLLIGLFISFVIIFLKNIYFGKIESIDDLQEKNSEIPVIGELSLIENNEKNKIINIDNNPLSFSLLRALRTNIDFALSGSKSKLILITSHNPSEGKTFMAANIASILAKANKKVLLLDLDLHKPSLHKTLGYDDKIPFGIIDILKSNCKIQEALISSVISNLDVIFAGKPEKTGSELLLNDKITTILEFAKDNYDYVLIDTPPVGLISDSLILMKYSDLNLYVVNSEIPYKDSLSQANEISKKNNFKLFFVLNKVKNKKIQYYYKNYQYAYAS